MEHSPGSGQETAKNSTKKRRKKNKSIKHRFPVAPSYKARNLTDEIIAKEEYRRG